VTRADDPEPVTPEPPREPGRTVFSQVWRQVAFVHWAVDPARLAPLLPAGARPDQLGDGTYIGLIAFRGVRAGLAGSPGLPYLGSFPEINVRAYSVDPAGRRGVVFLSLEASRLAPVLAARWVARLPYFWARMRVHGEDGTWTYRSRRRWPGPRGPAAELTLRVGERLTEPSEEDLFLTARWGLHQAAGRRTLYWPNAHREWPLHRAEVTHLDEDLLATAGVRVTGPPDSVLWSPGVDARFGPRRPVPR
jgi:uncharacterized protein YqjF (DUF2071 family)